MVLGEAIDYLLSLRLQREERIDPAGAASEAFCSSGSGGNETTKIPSHAPETCYQALDELANPVM